MKRTFSVLIVFMLIFVCILPAHAEIPALYTVGTPRSAIDSALAEQGITPTYSAADELVFADGSYSCLFTFDEETDTVNWLDITVDGTPECDLDFSLPDWRLTCPELLAQLDAAGVSYDLFQDSEGYSVYLWGTAFGLNASVCADFPQNGTLASIVIEDYDTAGLIPWVSYMTATLGIPDDICPFTDYTSGIVHHLNESMCWMRETALYSLSHDVSIVCFDSATGPESVCESDIVIEILPN